MVTLIVLSYEVFSGNTCWGSDDHGIIGTHRSYSNAHVCKSVNILPGETAAIWGLWAE